MSRRTVLAVHLRSSIGFILAAAIALVPCERIAAQYQRDDEATARAGLAAAEAAVAKKDVEGAILWLRNARQASLRLDAGPARDEFVPQIAERIAKIDPVARTLALAERDAVAKLLEAARLYEEKGWIERALDHVQMAERIDSEAVAGHVARLREGVAAARAQAPGDAFAEWFADGEGIGSGAKFAVVDRSIRMTAIRGKRDPVLYASGRRAKSDGLSLAVDVTADGVGGAGVVFAHRSVADQYAVVVDFGRTSAALVLVRNRGANRDMVQEHRFDRPAGPLRVGVRVVDGELEAFAGDEKLTAKLPGLASDGFLGVTAWRVADAAFAVTFDKFSVQATPHVPKLVRQYVRDIDGPPGGWYDAAKMTAMLAEIPELSAPDERVARALHDLRWRAAGLAEASERRALQPVIEKRLLRVDPTHPAAQKLWEAAARAMLKPAQDYLRRKWHRAAIDPLDHVRALHEPLGGKLWMDARKAAAAGPQIRSPIEEWMLGGKAFGAAGRWLFYGDLLETPKLGNGAVGVRSGRQLGTKYTVAVAVSAAPTPSRAGLAFAMKADTGFGEFVLLELHHREEGSLVLVYRCLPDRSFEQLLQREVTMIRAERTGFVDLRAEVDGNLVRVALGDLLTAEFRAPIQDLSGRVGCFVSGGTEYLGQVRFRDLRVD